MSQRVNSGFNASSLFVCAGDDIEVGPETNIIACSFNGLAFRDIVAWLVCPFFQSRDVGVAQPTIAATSSKLHLWPFAISLRIFAGRVICVRGVGHPPKPLPDVRRARARSRQIGGPDGISQCFQISTYSGEPFTSKLARNLFSKDCCRMVL